MLLAKRMASNFSSCEVASVDRRAPNSTVLVRLGLDEAAPDRNLLFPYLLGFRVGIATLFFFCPAGLLKVGLAGDRTLRAWKIR